MKSQVKPPAIPPKSASYCIAYACFYCVCMYVCSMCVYVCECMYVSIHVFVYTYTQNTLRHPQSYVHTYTHTHDKYRQTQTHSHSTKLHGYLPASFHCPSHLSSLSQGTTYKAWNHALDAYWVPFCGCLCADLLVGADNLHVHVQESRQLEKRLNKIAIEHHRLMVRHNTHTHTHSLSLSHKLKHAHRDALTHTYLHKIAIEHHRLMVRQSTHTHTHTHAHKLQACTLKCTHTYLHKIAIGQHRLMMRHTHTHTHTCTHTSCHRASQSHGFSTCFALATSKSSTTLHLIEQLQAVTFMSTFFSIQTTLMSLIKPSLFGWFYCFDADGTPDADINANVDVDVHVHAHADTDTECLFSCRIGTRRCLRSLCVCLIDSHPQEACCGRIQAKMSLLLYRWVTRQCRFTSLMHAWFFFLRGSFLSTQEWGAWRE